jgi:hypothetical protein
VLVEGEGEGLVRAMQGATAAAAVAVQQTVDRHLQLVAVEQQQEEEEEEEEEEEGRQLGSEPLLVLMGMGNCTTRQWGVYSCCRGNLPALSPLL